MQQISKSSALKLCTTPKCTLPLAHFPITFQEANEAWFGKVFWFNWLIDWLNFGKFFSSNYPKWLLQYKLGRFIKFLKLDLMNLVALYELLENDLRWINYVI